MKARGTLRRAAALLALVLLCMPGPAPAQEAVATRTLRPGTVLSGADLRAAGAGAGARIAALVGLETRRAIYAGRPVLDADLGPPTVVRRNAVVTMVYRDGALAIRAEGRALDPGGAGERIRVINLASRQTVAALVTGPDQVEVQR